MYGYEDAVYNFFFGKSWPLWMLVASMSLEYDNGWLEIFFESKLGSNPNNVMQNC